MAERHAKVVLLLGVIELILKEGSSFIDKFKASVELHRLWDEEDLEYIEQTLGQPLLVDKVACFNFCQVLIISAALLAELLYVRSKDLIPSLSLLVSFFSELFAHQSEVFLQIGQLRLPSLELVPFFLLKFSELTKGPMLDHLTWIAL